MTEKKSLWGRLKAGLQKSSTKISDGLKSIVTKRKLDPDTLDSIEELLITSDMGLESASKFTQALANERLDQDITIDEVKSHLAASISDTLAPVAAPIKINQSHKPHVVLVVGVNGSGKTTTIGKLAKTWRRDGLKVQMVAGDTFRAAAVQQLQTWGQRLDIPVFSRGQGADSAGLVFDALQQANKDTTDVMLIDTAGRLHNKADLMEELKKINRVIQKLDPTAPHSVILVLDATTGQNAHQQVKVFQELVGVTGLILTKLDGTAKGGVVVALAAKFGLPVHAVGCGESADDLRPFAADDFARNLVGLHGS